VECILGSGSSRFRERKSEALTSEGEALARGVDPVGSERERAKP